MTKQDLELEIVESEIKALEHYKKRLDGCIRKDFTAGVTHWLERIHQLEEIINERDASNAR